jgi:chromatin segregation and condensation protein Rec8/ScpA/Scc1 (kleisin family)
MDNLFEILIYVIIIISFLSSIFKKKQQPQKKPPVQQPRQEDYYQAEQTEVSAPQPQSKEEYDILRELEDFFKVGNEQTERRVPAPQQQTESLPSVEEHTKSEDWKSPTESEHYVDQWERKKTEVKKIISSVDSSIEKKAAMFEESLERKESVYSSFALAVKSKIKHPSTLKEYIIFSEILGKPKAFRR